jgi:hypothetical protein
MGVNTNRVPVAVPFYSRLVPDLSELTTLRMSFQPLPLHSFGVRVAIFCF